MLAAIVLALGHNARGNVSDAHSRICFVDVLTTCTAGAVGVNAQICRVDGHSLGFIGLCQNRHRTSAGVNAALCLSTWHALDAVPSRFKAHGAKNVVALDANDDLFVAPQLAGRL